MKTIKVRDAILIMCYFLFTSMFLYAAVFKLINFQVFSQQMKSQPFDPRFAAFLAWFIPISEIGLSIMMMTIKFRKPGIYLSTLLMVSFTIYIILIQSHFFNTIPCSCGGIITNLTWTQHLFFNLFYLLLGITAIYLEQSFKHPQINENEK